MQAVPFWPMMMKRATAARYCDLSVPAFEREVAAGRIPEPVLFGGSEHWSRIRLDQAVEALHGVADWRSQCGLHHAA